jgi:hypothetical protein
MTRFLVDESERGPEIHESRLDQDAYVSLAAAVLAKAVDDLDVKPYRAAARRFLLHDLPTGRTIWSDYFSADINRRFLVGLVERRCAFPARLKGPLARAR